MAAVAPRPRREVPSRHLPWPQLRPPSPRGERLLLWLMRLALQRILLLTAVYLFPKLAIRRCKSHEVQLENRPKLLLLLLLLIGPHCPPLRVAK